MLEKSKSGDLNKIKRGLDSNSHVAHLQILEGDSSTPVKDIQQLLSILPVEDFRGTGGAEWFELMAAVHSATGGSDEGFRIFDYWCKQDPNYVGDDFRYRWDSCRPNGEITVGTLLHLCATHVMAITDLDERRHGEEVIRRVCTLRNFKDFITLDDSAQSTEVTLGFDEKKVVDQVATCLRQLDEVYVRNNQLVQIYRTSSSPGWQQDAKPTTVFRLLPREQLRTLISQHCQFIEENLDKDNSPKRTQKRVPKYVVDHIFTQAEFVGVPVLRRIALSPTILPDGSILQSPGFNNQYGVLYAPNDDFPAVPESPTAEDVARACDVLNEPFKDFPFFDDYHAAVPIAAVLSMLTRDAFQGSRPGILIDGNQRGVGKSLLARTVAVIATGSDLSATNCPENDEEMRKRLTALAMEAAPGILIDNVPNAKAFGFPALDAFLTAAQWKDRILGQSKSTGDLEIVSQVFVTGNNISLPDDSDLVRRVLYCRLDCKAEDPENRSGFKHGQDEQLLEYASNHRGKLVQAALTILRAYRQQGSPRVDISEWGSYSAWSANVRAPLVWAGFPDPCRGRDLLKSQVDESTEVLAALITSIESLVGRDAITASELAEHLNSSCNTNLESLRNVVDETLDGGQLRNAHSIGRLLACHAGRVLNGKRLERKYCSRKRTRGWSVVDVGWCRPVCGP